MNALSTAPSVTENASRLNSTSLRSAGDQLFGGGAIAMLTGEPRPVLIGHLQWLDERTLLIFTAYGDGPSDAHLLRFDCGIVHDNGNITFLSEGNIAGVIHRIEDADVDDPDDYRIAWQLWQDVAPLHRPLIERSYEAVQALPRI